MSSNRVAVLGTYRSGSSIIAAMLDALGVDMGAPFWGHYFEPDDLARSLRRWWNEPVLEPKEPQSNRVLLLRQWAESRRNSNWIGCKHPLLCLSAEDVQRAWGATTKFIWTHRSLDDAVHSLEKMKWWDDSRRIQEKLYYAADHFFPRPNGIIIDFEDTIANPTRIVQRLVDLLGISPSPEMISKAVSVVQQRSTSAVEQSSVGADIRSTESKLITAETSASLPQVTPGKIVATMLAHNSEAVIGDAVKSVIDWVDAILLLDTGITDSSLEIAKNLGREKLVIKQYEWQGNFGAARNQALRYAAELGANWACTIDTDERIALGSLHSRDALDKQLAAAPDIDVWLVNSEDGLYSKERFIRLPSNLRWEGRAHEALCGVLANKRGLLPNVVFAEARKSPEAFAEKLSRDLRILREDVVRFPESGRIWYYLGQTLANLGQHEGAIMAFDRCSMIRDWDELAAWSCYMSAKSYAELGLFEESIERCAVGMAIDAYSPEIAWMAGWCYFKIEEFNQSIAWLHMSIALGSYRGIGARSSRIGFRDLIGWYEGPYDVLVHVYAKLGETALSQEAEAEKLRAIEARTRKPVPS